MNQRIGRRLTVLLTALAIVGLTPGLASAEVPPGKGLTTIECDEFGSATVTRGGGGPGWVDADGSMWLVVGGTFTGPGGEEFTFTQGKKTGLQDETATCSFSEGEFSAVIDLVRVR
jgi:hypothetical protein